MSATKSLANQKFYSLPENPNRVSKNKFFLPCKKRDDIAKLFKYIDDNLIGKHTTFTGPFGRRKVVYCDYISCGRSLQFIEDYISKEVLPNSGRPTATVNIVSLQSTLFRHEVKEFFKICANTNEEDVILFVSHGCDGPIRKLLQQLDFKEPPIVFVGSNEAEVTLMPWKELGAKIVKITESEEGFLDLNDLENQLLLHEKSGKKLIGCFSAANNISGILADDVATTLLLHQHGALSFWNYNIAAPYIELDMNPVLPGVEETAVYKDVIFFSMHNFLGGNQTPGILISKKTLFKNCSLNYFSSINKNNENVYHVIDEDVHDDCGVGTLVEIIRAGLVIHLKESVGLPAISIKQEKIIRTLLSHVKNIPELVLLGSNSYSAKRLPLFSFLIRHPRGMFLHHNFICAVLNDVFGIQVFGETVSADANSQDFMGIDSKLAESYTNVVISHSPNSSFQKKGMQTGLEILRPGFIKISLQFCMSDAELGFILEALKMVATEGWKLLPQYFLKPETGEWRHHSNAIFRDRKWLSFLKYVDGKFIVPERKVSAQGTCPNDYEECLQVARCIFNKARKIAQRYPLAPQNFAFDQEAESLRWFMLPKEAHDLLVGNSQNVKNEVPFYPNKRKGYKYEPAVDFNEKKGKKITNEENENQLSEGFLKKENFDTEETNLYTLKNQNYYTAKDNINNLQNFSLNSLPPSFVFQQCNNSSDTVLQSSCPTLFIPTQSQSYITTLPSSTNISSPTVNCYSFLNNYSQPVIQPFFPNQTDFYSPQNYTNKNHYLSSNGKDDICEKSFCTNQNFGTLRSDTRKINKQHLNEKHDPQQNLNKIHFLLGKNEISSRQRCNSLGSSLVYYPKNKGNLCCSCRSITDGETSLNLSECSLSSNEDIHAYVTEVTKELATEIKSEIREVISKVEDVLSESEPSGIVQACDTQGLKNYETKIEKLERTNSLPAASANDIAQYLMGVSKEMAEEMKSEIREIVSSVVSSETSPTSDKKKKIITGNKKNEETFRIENDKLKSNKSFHSRDSGINLSYAETVGEADKSSGISKENHEVKKVDVNLVFKQNRSESLDSLHNNEKTLRPRSESLDSFQENEDSDAAITGQISKRKIGRSSKKAEKYMAKNCLSEESSNDESCNMKVWANPKWCCPSKAVWKPAVEVLKQFEMIKDGDKILVYLSEGRNSVAILHILQQYKFYACSRGIRFEFGAFLYLSNSLELQIKFWKSYLQGLGIKFWIEEQINSTCGKNWMYKKGYLSTIAKDKNFNVIAAGQTLDDLAEFFFISAFHNGRLQSLKAHYISDGDVRVIRPILYVREKALRQFVDSRKLPYLSGNCLPCKIISKKSQTIKQMLLHQESIFPRFFNNLKTALQPLICHKIVGEERKTDKYTTDSDEI